MAQEGVPLGERARPDERMTLADIGESLSLQEAAAAAHVSVATIRRAIRAGRLSVFTLRGVPATGGGNAYRVTVPELERWVLGKPKGDRA